MATTTTNTIIRHSKHPHLVLIEVLPRHKQNAGRVSVKRADYLGRQDATPGSVV